MGSVRSEGLKLRQIWELVIRPIGRIATKKKASVTIWLGTFSLCIYGEKYLAAWFVVVSMFFLALNWVAIEIINDSHKLIKKLLDERFGR